MMKKTITFLILTLTCIQFNAQISHQFSMDSVKMAFNEILKESDYKDYKPEQLTNKQKYDLLFYLVDNENEDLVNWCIVYNWLVKSGINIEYKHPEHKQTALEFSFNVGSERSAYNLITSGAKIPAIIYDEKCKYKDMSPLALAADEVSPSLSNLLLEFGVQPDSTCLYPAYRYFDLNDAALLFEKVDYNKIKVNNKNVVANIYNQFYQKRRSSRKDYWLNIDPIYKHEQNHLQLIQALAENDTKTIDKLLPAFLEFYKKYEKIEENADNHYEMDKFGILVSTAADRGNTEVLDKLYPVHPKHCEYAIRYFTGAYPENVQIWMIEKAVYDNVIVDPDGDRKIDFFSRLFVYNPLLLKHYLQKYPNTKLLDDLDIVACIGLGGDKELIKLLYKQKTFDKKEIFEALLDGDSKAIRQYISKNGNPFIKDAFKVTLFDYMQYFGMEKEALQILKDNKYLPVDDKTIGLALLSGNKQLLNELVTKTNMADYCQSLYRLALLRKDVPMLKELQSRKLSAAKIWKEGQIDIAYLNFDDDIEILKLFLQAGMPLDKNIYGGSSILNWHVMNTHFDFYFDSPLLVYAVLSRNLEVVKVLVEHGADIHQKVEKANLASFAAAFSSPEIIDYLASKGVDFSEATERNYTPLRVAVKTGNAENVRKLIEIGVKFQPWLYSDGKKHRPLIHRAKDYATWKALYDNGYRDYKSLSNQLAEYIDHGLNDKALKLTAKYDTLLPKDPLGIAFWQENSLFGKVYLAGKTIEPGKYVKDALDRNAMWFFEYCYANEEYSKAINEYKDKEGNSTLMLAIKEYDPWDQRIDFITYFLNKDIDVNTTNHSGETAFFLLKESSMRNKEKLLQLLQSKGAKKAYSKGMIKRGFEDAFNSNNMEKLIEFLEMGADPNEKIITSRSYYSKNDTTMPLVSSLKRDKEELSTILLLYGADPNTENFHQRNDEYSPLSYAIGNNQYNLAKLLVYMGADPDKIPEQKEEESCRDVPSAKETLLRYGILKPDYKKISKYSIDSLISKAILTNNKTQLFKLLQHAKSNKWYVFDYKILSSLFSNVSVKDFEKIYNNYLDESKKDASLYIGAMDHNRFDIMNLLVDKKLPFYREPGELIAVLINKGARANSYAEFTKITDACNKNETYTYDENANNKYRKEILATAKKILSTDSVKTNNYQTERAFRAGFFEMALLTMQLDTIPATEKKAFEYIANNQNNEFEALLNSGLNVNAKTGKISLLAWACALNNQKAFDLLMEKGAIVAEETSKSFHDDNDGFKAETWAIINGNHKMVEKLRQKGGNRYVLEVYNHVISTPFDFYIWKNDIENLKYFLDKGYIDLASGTNRKNAMANAIAADKPEIMTLLFNYPAGNRAFEKSFHGYGQGSPTDSATALEYSIIVGAKKCFDQLKNNAPAVKSLVKKRELLHHAPNPEINKWIINQGYRFGTAYSLERALKNGLLIGDDNYIDLLLNKADSTIVKPIKEYGFHYNSHRTDNYAFDGNVALVKTLIKHDLIKDKNELLEKAIIKGHKELIKHLIETGTPWIMSNYGRSFLPDEAVNNDIWEYTVDLILSKVRK